MRDLKEIVISLTEKAKNAEEFKKILFRFMRLIINLIQNTEELYSELEGRNFVYQLYIKNYDISFWISHKDGKLNLGEGTYPNPDLKVKMDKEIFKKILEEKIKGRVAYMKGLIKAEGDLTKGMIFINTFEHLFDFLRNRYQ